MELVGYEAFKGRLLDELKDFYGEDAAIAINRVVKNNGQGYDGLHIVFKGARRGVFPVIDMGCLYAGYLSNGMDMDGCVEEVYRVRKMSACPEEIRELAEGIREWGYAKGNVYPILLPTEENRGMLGGLVSAPMLDLSVAYIIRGKEYGNIRTSVKVTESLLGYYGVSHAELHRQAMENLRRDGYTFMDMASAMGRLLPASAGGLGQPDGFAWKEMYVLTNSQRVYGAAGILDRELVRGFAKGRSFFILPSSIHETIFVPVSSGDEKEAFDRVVEEVNATKVLPEERLSNHAYYYDAGADEIRMHM